MKEISVFQQPASQTRFSHDTICRIGYYDTKVGAYCAWGLLRKYGWEVSNPILPRKRKRKEPQSRPMVVAVKAV